MKTLDECILTSLIFLLSLYIVDGREGCGCPAVQDPPPQKGCCAGHSKNLRGSHEMKSDTGCSSFSFEWEDNQILLPVKINGQGPFRLILDTGMPMDGAVLYDTLKARALNPDFVGKAITPGTPCDEKSPPNLADHVSLELPEVILEDQWVSLMPVENTLGGNLVSEGIIGKSIFGRFVVAVDYDKRKVTLTEPDRFTYKGKGHEFAAPLNELGMPELRCEVTLDEGRRVAIRPIVDTGAGHALSLNVGNPEGVTLPEKTIQTCLGRSLFGDIYGHIGRIQGLHLGPLTLERMVTSFVSGSSPIPCDTDKEGNLGNGALCRFNVVFDYARERMILEPNSRIGDPFDYVSAGIEVKRTSEGIYRIERVLPASPAHEAGLEVADLLARINGRPVEEFGKEDLVKMFRQAGVEMVVRVRRGDEEREIQLTPRSLI